ncbi:MAG: metallophosphoesterase [Nanoarchaeota archaeon]|nr:metallophosphoesterase [Nanoarchaeota archaeon]
MKKLILVLLISFFIIGCGSPQGFPDPSKPTTFGIIADIHADGDYDNLGKILDRFEEKEVDAIIIAGDLSLNEQHSYGRPDKVEDDEEIYMVLKRTLMRGYPTYVIPGNHETKEAWNKAMARLKDDDFLDKIKNYDKLFDMTKIRTLDRKDIDILSLPGCVDEKVTPEDGFIADADELFVLSQRLDDDILLIGHCPPLGSGDHGIDVLESGKHVGSEHLLEVMQDSDIKFAVFGHIHESAGAVDQKDAEVMPRQVTSSLFFNPGASQDGSAGIFYYYKVDGRAKYEEIIVSNK